MFREILYRSFLAERKMVQTAHHDKTREAPISFNLSPQFGNRRMLRELIEIGNRSDGTSSAAELQRRFGKGWLDGKGWLEPKIYIDVPRATLTSTPKLLKYSTLTQFYITIPGL